MINQSNSFSDDELRGMITGDNPQSNAFRELLSFRESTTKILPALNKDLIEIMGRPNFSCSGIAGVLRDCGVDIPKKSENEQAAVIHYLLGFYLEHGDKWLSVAESDLQDRVAKATASDKNG